MDRSARRVGPVGYSRPTGAFALTIDLGTGAQIEQAIGDALARCARLGSESAAVGALWWLTSSEYDTCALDRRRMVSDPDEPLPVRILAAARLTSGDHTAVREVLLAGLDAAPDTRAHRAAWQFAARVLGVEALPRYAFVNLDAVNRFELGQVPKSRVRWGEYRGRDQRGGMPRRE